MAKGTPITFQVGMQVQNIQPYRRALHWPYRVYVPLELRLHLPNLQRNLPFVIDSNASVSVIPRVLVEDILTIIGPLGAPRVTLDADDWSPFGLEGRLTNPLQVEFPRCPNRRFAMQFLVADNAPQLRRGLLSLRDVHRYFQLQMGGQQVAYAPVLIGGYMQFTVL